MNARAVCASAATVLEGAVGTTVTDGGGQIACPRCSAPFTPRRKDQRYCAKSCAKAATRNAARGDRTAENAQRTQGHYERAAWLSFDVLRMSPQRQRRMILSILEAASGSDAPLRNILLDPALLGAVWGSSIGKRYPDTRDHGAPNIAKMVDAFCRMEWGCSARDAILDHGKPAHCQFTETDEPADAPPEVTYWRTPEAAGGLRRLRGNRPATAKGYDWRRIARAMGDPGWQQYFTSDELDGML